jgi:hypothetical protein
MSEINTDSLRNERMLFLKELASLPDRDAYELCDTLSIPKVKVMTFLRTYFKAYATFSDRDDRLPRQAYQDLRNEISIGVATEFGELSDKDIDNLCYVYEKYRKIDPSLYLEADQVRAGKLFAPQQVAHDSSNIPSPDLPHTPFTPPSQSNDEPKTADYYNRPTQTRPPTVNDPNQAEFNVDRLNKGYSYDFLYGLSRIGLLRFVLEGLPYPPSGNKVEGFVQFFELNQDELMASPDALRDRLQKYFGDKTGEQASVAFNSYIRYLKPGEKFGVPKLRGQLRDGYFLGDDPMYARGPQPQGASAFGTIPYQFNEQSGMWGPGAEGAAVRNPGAGPKWQDPYNTYYHAELVLPFGMDARSTDAARLIHEWEAKKKRKREDDEANAEILQKINQKMSFSMADVLNQGKMMGNGHSSSLIGPDFIQAMIAMQMIASVNSGKANVMPYTDENGKIQLKMEAVPQLDHQITDPNAIGPRDIITLIQSMYEKIGEKSDQAMQARIDGLKDAMGFNGERKDPIQQVGETVKALRETIPGFDRQFTGSGMGDPVEMARLDLERQKFSYDRERSDKLIDQSWEIKKMEREHEMEAELEANKTRKEAIKGITKTLSSALPTIIQVVMMLISMRNPTMAPLAGAMGGGAGGAGPLGGLGDMVGKLLGGMMGGKGGDEDEEGGEEESLTSFLKKKTQGDSEDEDEEDEEEGGGFNLGKLVNDVMPSVMGMMGGMNKPQQPMYSPQANEPEIHSGHHHHKNQMRQYEQGDGFRPTFMDVEIGNSAASTVQPVIPAGQRVDIPDNIYENIQEEQEVITNRPNVSPELVGMIEEGTDKAQENTDVNDPNVIKLPRYQDKLLGENSKMTSPQEGVVIPQPRQTVNEYQGEDDDEAEEDPYPIYQVEDFDDMPTEQLRPAQNEGLQSMKSAESYFKSINQQMKKRATKGSKK